MAAELRLPSRSLLLAIAVLSLVVRVGVVVATPNFHPVGDAVDYDAQARSLSSDGHFPPTLYARPGSPTALRPPGYPVLLALVYKVAGPSWTAGRLVAAVLGVATVLLITLIAARLGNVRMAVIAGVLAAVYPPLVMVNGSLLSEALYLPLMLGLVLVLLTWPPPERVTRSVLAAGCLCGLAALTRSVGLLLVAPALVLTWRARRRTAMTVLLLVTTVATVAPWTLRNAHAFHALVPVSTQDWVTAVGTYNADSARPGPAQAIWRPFYFIEKYKPVVNDQLDENEIDGMMRTETLAYVSRHPTYPALVGALNSLRLFGLGPGHVRVERMWYGEMGIPVRAQAWTRWSVYAMSLAALLTGLLLLPRRWRGVPPVMWIVPVLMFLSVVAIHGGPRYRVPVDPFLVLAAAAGLSRLAAVLPRYRGR